MAKTNKGLKGLTVADSSICSIDGKKGVLEYRGYDVRDLAQHSSFEETAYLLWYGKLPNRKQLSVLTKKLKQNRRLPKRVLDFIKASPKGANPMAVLRTAVSMLALDDPDADNINRDAIITKVIHIVSKMPTIIAASHRSRDGKKLITPSDKLSHAENFLYMMSGKVPDKFCANTMERCLVLHADHSFNASGFSARVTSSTLSDVYSALTSAIATLKGPLHGGANAKVMEMFKEIGVPENAEEYINKKLARHERIMGFGHRVYKVKDPRAYILEEYVNKLEGSCRGKKWYSVAKEVERVVTARLGKKKLYPNVDFFSGAVYYCMGIPADIYPTIFALARAVGWSAHMMEQYEDNMLIRPLANYTGKHNRRYIPIGRRK